MESLVEVSEQEVRIDFTPNTKCRANVRLRSLCATCHVAFKVQTSSPHKFLVNPPAGVLAPLSCATFQVILKPQPNPPNSFPRSPSDRFLIRTARFPAQQLGKPGSTHPNSVISWFASRPTQDHKLKTAFVGAFLLRRAVAAADHDAARNLIKRHKSVLAELTPRDSESLLRVATELAKPEAMVNLLLDSGLKIGFGSDSPAGPAEEVDLTPADDKGHTEPAEILGHGELVLTAARLGDLNRLEWLLKAGSALSFRDQYGLTPLHAAAMKGHKDVLLRLIEVGADLESQDHQGHSPLHLAVAGGSLEAVEALLSEGANINVKSRTSVSPLDMATAIGHDKIAKFLISNGASSSSSS